MYHNIQHSIECVSQSCSSCIRTDQLYTLKWFLRKEKGNKNVNLVFKNNLTNNNNKKKKIALKRFLMRLAPTPTNISSNSDPEA